jgi:hypothetical protein
MFQDNKLWIDSDVSSCCPQAATDCRTDLATAQSDQRCCGHQDIASVGLPRFGRYSAVLAQQGACCNEANVPGVADTCALPRDASTIGELDITCLEDNATPIASSYRGAE